MPAPSNSEKPVTSSTWHLCRERPSPCIAALQLQPCNRLADLKGDSVRANTRGRTKPVLEARKEGGPAPSGRGPGREFFSRSSPEGLKGWGGTTSTLLRRAPGRGYSSCRASHLCPCFQALGPAQQRGDCSSAFQLCNRLADLQVGTPVAPSGGPKRRRPGHLRKGTGPRVLLKISSPEVLKGWGGTTSASLRCAPGGCFSRCRANPTGVSEANNPGHLALRLPPGRSSPPLQRCNRFSEVKIRSHFSGFCFSRVKALFSSALTPAVPAPADEG
jgi:hypothetical protein